MSNLKHKIFSGFEKPKKLAICNENSRKAGVTVLSETLPNRLEANREGPRNAIAALAWADQINWNSRMSVETPCPLGLAPFKNIILPLFLFFSFPGKEFYSKLHFCLPPAQIKAALGSRERNWSLGHELETFISDYFLPIIILKTTGIILQVQKNH